jgi:mitochondrial fission protein ELM1
MSVEPIHILALLDDRAGNNSQVLGVAEKLGHAFESIELRYNFLTKLPNKLLGASLRHLRANCKTLLKNSIAERIESSNNRIIVITAGRRSAPVARWIKKQNPNTFICSIMGTDGGEQEFDLIALPLHDKGEDSRTRELEKNNTDHRPLTADNYLFTLTAPHPITPEKLGVAGNQWRHAFEGKPKPWICVLVGGSTRHATFNARDYQALSETLARIRNESGGSLFITTSRRTSKEGAKILQQYLFSDDVFFAYKKGLPASENPYLGMLANADSIIVTGDSVSMCSEAISTGKPVYVYAPDEDNIAPKFQRFLKGLYSGNHARELGFPLASSWLPTPSVDTTTTIAETILKKAL